jgi:hypothetical protein
VPTIKRKDSKQVVWNRFHSQVKGSIPTVVAWFDDRDEFRELRLKARDDGTILAVAKGYGSDGGLVVSFAVGYDVVTALMALDGVLQSGAWRLDKPWRSNGRDG